MRMKWLPAGIGLFLVGMSVVSFAGERVYEQAEFPHEICGTWTDIHGGRTLEITPVPWTEIFWTACMMWPAEECRGQ